MPEDKRNEQLAFVANTLKLPSNSNLINFKFINGNYWIIASFEHEGDLISCQEKINNKNKSFLDFIQLSLAHNPKTKQLNESTNNKLYK